MTSINGIPTPAPTGPTTTTTYLDAVFGIADEVLAPLLGDDDADETAQRWIDALFFDDEEIAEFHAWWEATHGPGAMTPDVQ